MHAGLDEIVAEAAEHIGADVAVGIERRHQIRKNAVKISHKRVLVCWGNSVTELYRSPSVVESPNGAPMKRSDGHRRYWSRR